MRKSAIVSASVHLGLLALVVFGLPELLEPLPQPAEPMSVEMLDLVSEVANPPPPQRVKTAMPPIPTAKPLPPAPALKETAPPPVAAPVAPDTVVEQPVKVAAAAVPRPPTPVLPAQSPPRVAAKAPPPDPIQSKLSKLAPVPAKTVEPPVENAKPKEKKPQEKKPAPKDKPKAQKKPKPKEKPKAEEKPKPKQHKPTKPRKQDKSHVNLAELDALLNNDPKPQGSPPPPTAQESAKPNREVTPNHSGRPLSMSEKNAIAGAIGQRWNVDLGAKGVEGMSVKIKIHLNRDGTLNGQPQVIMDRSRAGDPAYRAFVDKAYRAIIKVHKFPVPPGKYDTWNDMIVNFRPEGVTFGG